MGTPCQIPAINWIDPVLWHGEQCFWPNSEHLQPRVVSSRPPVCHDTQWAMSYTLPIVNTFSTAFFTSISSFPVMRVTWTTLNQGHPNENTNTFVVFILNMKLVTPHVYTTRIFPYFSHKPSLENKKLLMKHTQFTRPAQCTKRSIHT